jgi:hypothetical protein
MVDEGRSESGAVLANIKITPSQPISARTQQHGLTCDFVNTTTTTTTTASLILFSPYYSAFQAGLEVFPSMC